MSLRPDILASGCGEATNGERLESSSRSNFGRALHIFEQLVGTEMRDSEIETRCRVTHIEVPSTHLLFPRTTPPCGLQLRNLSRTWHCRIGRALRPNTATDTLAQVMRSPAASPKMVSPVPPSSLRECLRVSAATPLHHPAACARAGSFFGCFERQAAAKQPSIGAIDRQALAPAANLQQIDSEPPPTHSFGVKPRRCSSTSWSHRFALRCARLARAITVVIRGEQ